MSYDDKAEATREFYRKQGDERTIKRVLDHLMDDAVVRMTFTVEQVKKVVEIVEGDYVRQL